MQKNSSGRCDADLQQMVFCVKIERRKTGIQGKMENHYRGERDGGKCKIRGGVIQDSGGTYRKTVRKAADLPEGAGKEDRCDIFTDQPYFKRGDENDQQ